jgi:hypothetical protein
VLLFKWYRHVTTREFELELKDAMEGVKRYTNEAVQHSEGNIYNGERALTWGLYSHFNQWFYEDGSAEGIFAVIFSKMTCNLA